MRIAELADTAAAVQRRLRERGEMSLTARPSHGKVLLEVDGAPFARLSPMPNACLQISYHTSTAKWESMPFAADTPKAAADMLLDVLGPHLQAFTMG